VEPAGAADELGEGQLVQAEVDGLAVLLLVHVRVTSHITERPTGVDWAHALGAASPLRTLRVAYNERRKRQGRDG
jgi:hypothetical protein